MTLNNYQYPQAEIITFMKQHPNMNIRDIAVELEVSTMVISQAQHEHLLNNKTIKRDSPLWDLPGYSFDPRPWLPLDKLNEFVIRLQNKEKGLYEQIQKDYKINIPFKKQLKAAV